MIKLLQSEARTLPVIMIDSTDHIAPKTGLVEGDMTVNISKDGGALGGFAPEEKWTERGQGYYTIDFAIGDLDTVGFFVYLVTAAGCDQYSGVVYVDSFSDYKADVAALALEATLSAGITTLGDEHATLGVGHVAIADLINALPEDADITALAEAIAALPQDADITAAAVAIIAEIVAAHAITDGKVDLNTVKLNTAQDDIDTLIARISEALTTALIAAAVWDEDVTGHETVDTVGRVLSAFMGKWVMEGNQLKCYGLSGNLLFTFDLTRDGEPTEFNPKKRDPA